MTKPARKSATHERHRAPPSSPVRATPAERLLARSALLARECLSAKPAHEAAAPKVPGWPLVGSMLIH